MNLSDRAPYRLVRHPIYTSMLCVLLGTGVLISPLYLLLPAVLIFLIGTEIDRKSTRLNSSHLVISYAVFCLKKKKKTTNKNCNHRNKRSAVIHDTKRQRR